MKNPKIKISALLFTVLFSTTIFFSWTAVQGRMHVAHASFLDIIRALVTINPLEVDVSAPAEVEIGKVFKVEASLINKGEDVINKAEAQIFVPEGLTLLKDSTQNRGVIRGEREKTASWQIRGEVLGSYIISVKATGILGETAINAEDSALVKIIEKSPLYLHLHLLLPYLVLLNS